MSVSSRIDPVIQDIVEKALEEIETSLGARILLAVDAGLRGQGMESVDSPYRIMFVYVHRLDWYLKLSPGPATVELPASDDFSLTGWDIRHLVEKLKQSSATETTWLNSGAVYRSDEDLTRRLAVLQRRVWQPASALADEIKIATGAQGKWSLGHDMSTEEFLTPMYATLSGRAIAEDNGPPPQDIRVLYDGLSAEVTGEMDCMLSEKAKNVANSESPPSFRSQIFLNAELERLQTVELPTHPAPDDSLFDRFLADTIRRFG
ncbi:DNA polymerase beta superfamily protein [Acetobacter sp.]|uniref:DNA polymerase beta superfamily protein n=1 Tax=Acetobacter sp. TaxID=440 RepID=UPI0025C47B68|nr:nucleotidyltransferase domain-containing protein [Acetobacter sp.]MCH4090473.1 nucleotidyltransferase domain-containing protein [Acetobacter sp.]MCI1299167.1 nucleotidyltransferase domain-containing protein [Acetobacter sp.]MCI1315714.1 nucleotidyltransferase domain-containing protein [Acetobacter sp.]